MKFDGIKAESVRMIEYTSPETCFCSSLIAVKYLQS